MKKAESKTLKLPTRTKAPSSTMDKIKASSEIGRLCAMMDFWETTFFSTSEGRERLAAIANDEQAWNGLGFIISGMAEDLRELEGAILTAPDLPACRG